MLTAVYGGEQFAIVWRGVDGPLQPEPTGRRCVDCCGLTPSARHHRCEPCRASRWAFKFRAYQAGWYRSARVKAKAAGLCSRCRRRTARDGFATCDTCAAVQAAKARRRRRATVRP